MLCLWQVFFKASMTYFVLAVPMSINIDLFVVLARVGSTVCYWPWHFIEPFLIDIKLDPLHLICRPPYHEAPAGPSAYRRLSLSFIRHRYWAMCLCLCLLVGRYGCYVAPRHCVFLSDFMGDVYLRDA